MGANATVAQGRVVAYPNPAKDAVHFRYQLDEQQGMAWLTVQDLNGRLVAKLPLAAGSNSVKWSTSGLSSGVYYYKTSQVGGIGLTQKLVLIK
jgi:flagellar hook assembly protein FlgD